MQRGLAKFIVSALVLIFSICGSFAAYAGEGQPYDKIVFFGDSLSDNGNLYSIDRGYMPKSPPYFEGRFSNGPVWSEYVAKYLYDKNYTVSVNEAYGGETAIAHDPINGYLPWNLWLSVHLYDWRHPLTDFSSSLFVIWAGANDYLPGLKQANSTVELLTDSVVANISGSVEYLISKGAKNFLIINMPDLSFTPSAHINKDVTPEELKDLSLTHNQKLRNILAVVQNNFKEVNIQLFDINAIFSDFISRPDYYNEKYHVNVTNTTTPCWGGGYTLRHNKPATEDEIAQDFETYLRAHPDALAKGEQIPANKIDTRDFAHTVAGSPSLREAYEVAQSQKEGAEACPNPDQYIFWDKVHPTALVHRVVSLNLIEFIDKNFVAKPSPYHATQAKS